MKQENTGIFTHLQKMEEKTFQYADYRVYNSSPDIF